MKYLIIEDCFSDVALLRVRIKRLGYEVTVADPNDSMTFARSNHPAVIQLDGLCGKCFELIDALKEDCPDSSYIIFSADDIILDNGRRRGLITFDKSGGGVDLLEYLQSLK
ncbi:hypothetical protein J4218_03270 [Candidatus Pacearchaeota archaeon]|nr:hypothetical protein [Candidatus Pacearchaeota archaeon]